MTSWDGGITHVFLLLVDMADLKPNVFLGQGAWRVTDNVLEALEIRRHVRHPSMYLRSRHVTYLQALLIFLLLFVYYPESEVDLISFLKVWLHAHDLRECLLCVFKGAIAIVKYANAIPKLGFLDIQN